jgi:hypothetical protein
LISYVVTPLPLQKEPAFLKGQSSRSGVEVSPIKIVKNPDGSMQRAAMTQSALAKERRELKEQQQRTLLEAIPKDLSRFAACIVSSVRLSDCTYVPP